MDLSPVEQTIDQLATAITNATDNLSGPADIYELIMETRSLFPLIDMVASKSRHTIAGMHRDNDADNSARIHEVLMELHNMSHWANAGDQAATKAQGGLLNIITTTDQS